MFKPSFFLQILPGIVIVLAAFIFVVFKTLSRLKPRGYAGPAASRSNGGFAGSGKALEMKAINGVFPVTVGTGRDSFEARAKEISLAGAFIICDRPLPVGEDLELSLELAESIRLRATVTWNNTNVPGEQIVVRGMRVRFLDLSEKARAALSAGPPAPKSPPAE